VTSTYHKALLYEIFYSHSKRFNLPLPLIYDKISHPHIDINNSVGGIKTRLWDGYPRKRVPFTAEAREFSLLQNAWTSPTAHPASY
jgi:hypothetical protein